MSMSHSNSYLFKFTFVVDIKKIFNVYLLLMLFINEGE